MTQTSLPRLTIMLLTYEPGERQTAYRVLEAALDHIRYSGELHVHIADDGSPAGHVDRLREIAGGYSHVVTVGVSNAHRGGYGRSFNLATQKVHSGNPRGLVLPLEDDWLLTRDLDLDKLAETLSYPGTWPGIQCVRLGYLGFTQLLHGEVHHTPAGPMLVLNKDSAEPHIAAGHPRLETVVWQKNVGPWAEGLAPGATEFEWCRRPTARMGVAWPLDYSTASQTANSLFLHIGAYALGELEPETR